MKYKSDAYEQNEYNLTRVVYVERTNLPGFSCVFQQLLNEEGFLEEYDFDEVRGVFVQVPKKNLKQNGGKKFKWQQ